MNTRRQFLIRAPLGLLGAAAACRGQSQQVSPVAGTPTGASPSSGLPAGAPPTFGTANAVGPEVSVATFAEAEKLAQVQMTSAERTMAAATWRSTMAPLLERRVGPRKIVVEPDVAPATRWDPVM